MSKYRRFVAYVYEYRKGKKENNCGFVKVEAWDEKCTIEVHLQCEGILAGGECRIYGFVREGIKMEGIFLGNCCTERDSVKCILETSSKRMGEQPVSLDMIGGMVFTTEFGGFFGTEWDDAEIVPDNFEEMLKEDEKKTEPEMEEVLQLEENIETELQPEDEKKVVAAEVQEEVPGEPYMPFEDEEFINCRKIKPGDISCFSRKNCPLRQNRFLLYGYYNFGHLLLCTKEDGQLILGVPGVYDQQEHFMANMFGFPFFRKSREIRVSEGTGGYWYRLINSPDFH